MARTHQQVIRGPDLVQEQISHETSLVVNKLATTESREALSSYSPTSLQDGTLEDQPIQCGRSPMSADIKEEMTEMRCAPTSQWTGNTLMAVRTWRTDGNPMAMGMQWTNISPKAVGTQFTGSDLRTGTAHSHQQSSTHSGRMLIRGL